MSLPWRCLVTAPRKRTASEPASALFEAEDAVQVDDQRPAALIGGTLLMLARAASSVVWGVALFAERHDIATALDLEPLEIRVLIGFLLTIAGLWMLLLILLAWRIWRGSNRARMLVLFGATVSIIFAAIGYFAAGERIAIDTTLLTLALDILILLSLSSREARAWSRARREARRRARRSGSTVGDALQ